MRILLVDDHVLFREGLKFLLSSLEVDLVLSEVSDCNQALALAVGNGFELILLDLKLPGIGGMSAVHAIKDAFPATPVVVLSGEDDPHTVRAAIDAGAMGFVPKSSTPKVLVQALRLVLTGGIYLPAQALNVNPGPVLAGDVKGLSAGLSSRQLEVLRAVIQGKPNKLIARELQIAEGTVKVHLSAVMRTLGVRNRTETVYAAAKMGLQLS